MRYVFLDFDGVLNSAKFFEETRPFDREAELSDFDRSLGHIDPSAVELLNSLVGAGIGFVVSSTWRTLYPQHHLQAMLAHKGFKGLLLGCTPSLPYKRGDEIDRYLSAVKADTFVILDDDSDMDPHMDQLVQTSNEIGLTESDVKRARHLLGM